MFSMEEFYKRKKNTLQGYMSIHVGIIIVCAVSQ